jgi:hypothetical protein
LNLDSSMVLDYFIPDSPTDAGAILLWVLLIVLAVLIIVNVRMVLQVRTIPSKKEEPPQGHPPVGQREKPREEPERSYGDIHTKVDQLIEMNKL